MGRWSQAAGFEAVDGVGATMFVGNPPLLEELLAESRPRGHPPGAAALRASGGGPVPSALKSAWRDELKIPLVESYGQSELGGFVALGYPELEPDSAKLMRIGPPLPDKEVAACDLEDRPLPSGRSASYVCAAASWRATGAAGARRRRRRAAAGCAPATSASSTPTASSPCAAGAPS